MSLVVLGVDPHKQSHMATALAAGSQHQLGSLRIPASTTGYVQLVGWARQFPQRRWAIENARGLGCHLTQWLLARGETVQDVRTTATARVRELSRGRGCKTDVLDAAAAAGVAALQGDAEPLKPEGRDDGAGGVGGAAQQLVAQRTRSVNQLHAVLCELVAGGAPPKLRADKAAALLRTVHPVTAADRARKQIAWELVAEVRGLDRQLAVINKRLHDTVTALGSRLTQTVGVGPVIAGRLLGRTGRASRFPAAAHFASYIGAAPLEVASGEHARHRLSAPVTGSATMPCTSLRSSRLAAQAAPATTTSDASSPRARPPGKPCAASAPDRRPRLAGHARRRTSPRPTQPPSDLTHRGAHLVTARNGHRPGPSAVGLPSRPIARRLDPETVRGIRSAGRGRPPAGRS
jgi:transposase